MSGSVSVLSVKSDAKEETVIRGSQEVSVKEEGQGTEPHQQAESPTLTGVIEEEEILAEEQVYGEEEIVEEGDIYEEGELSQSGGDYEGEEDYYDGYGDENYGDYLGKRDTSDNTDLSHNLTLGPHKYMSYGGTYYPYYDEQPGYDNYEITELDETIQEMMLKLQKNPVALLHEYSSKAKLTLDFKFGSNSTKGSFSCQVQIKNEAVHPEFEGGDSKQDAKKNAANEAIKSLSQDEHSRLIIAEILARQRKNQMNVQDSIKKGSTNYNSIDELLHDDMNILATLNSFAQNCKEALKWRIRTDGNLCLAEIRIGQLVASAVKTNKKQAKLWASKNLLKVINTNTFLREKFLYYTSTAMKESNQNANEEMKKTLELVPDNAPQFDGNLLDIDPCTISHSELREWFYHLDNSIQIEEKQWIDASEVFQQVSDMLTNLFPGQGLVIVPIGSFLLGCMRKCKREIDAVIFSETLATNLSFERIKNSFYDRKDSFQLINNSYRFYDCSYEGPDKGKSILSFTHTFTETKVIFRNFEPNGSEYTNQNGKTINMLNSSIYHAIWLEELISNQNISQDLIKIMRMLREWRDINELDIPTEVLDVGVYYSTSYFKEFDLMRVILKFFALLNLLINPYNFYFYELSEYHSFFIKDKKQRILAAAHKSFLALSINDPTEFASKASSK